MGSASLKSKDNRDVTTCSHGNDVYLGYDVYLLLFPPTPDLAGASAHPTTLMLHLGFRGSVWGISSAVSVTDRHPGLA